MVQLQNADRLNMVIDFGYQGMSEEDENGVSFPTFVSKFKARGGPWQLSLQNLIELTGNNQAGTEVYIVRHRPQSDWDEIQNAKIGKRIYKFIRVDTDPYRNPTAYDRVTLSKVVKNG